MIWLELALIGASAGFLAGYLGIGGGIILVPALAWLFSSSPETSRFALHLAIATSLASMLVTSLSSVLAHHRRRAILWPLTLRLAPGLMLGSMLGAVIADQVNGRVLSIIIGIFALMVGGHLLAGKAADAARTLPGRAAHAALGVLFGTISALVGIGGGSLTVPWFLRHGILPQNAVATAAACGYPIAIAGSAAFVALGWQDIPVPDTVGYIHVPAMAGASIFGALAAPIGAAAVHRTPAQYVRRVFGVFLMAVAAVLLSGWRP